MVKQKTLICHHSSKLESQCVIYVNFWAKKNMLILFCFRHLVFNNLEIFVTQVKKYESTKINNTHALFHVTKVISKISESPACSLLSDYNFKK